MSTSSSSPGSTSPGVALRVSRPAFWGLAILLVAPWIALIFAYVHRREPAALSAEAASQGSSGNSVRVEPSAAQQIKRCRPGPWGDLEYTPILIEPPEEFVRLDYPQASLLEWYFGGYTREQLAGLWRTARLTPDQVAQLEKATLSQGASCIVTAHRDLVFSLDPAARAIIYGVLSRFAENDAQANPFRFRSDRAEDWLRNSGLSDHATALVRGLIYRRGTSILFSDQHLVMPLLNSDTERLRLMKTLARKSTMLLKLRVTKASDVDALTRYWSHMRAKDVRPLLQSIADLPGGGSVDVAHLLPRVVRSLLYTYPIPEFEPDAPARDCHWTSLNFFRDEPDDGFMNMDKVHATLVEQYYPVAGEPQFGDLLVFVRDDNAGVHSCTYIAEDIVFTKNGPDPTVPWILMTMSDLQAFYPEDPPLRILRYRLKNR